MKNLQLWFGQKYWEKTCPCPRLTKTVNRAICNILRILKKEHVNSTIGSFQAICQLGSGNLLVLFFYRGCVIKVWDIKPSSSCIAMQLWETHSKIELVENQIFKFNLWRLLLYFGAFSPPSSPFSIPSHLWWVEVRKRRLRAGVTSQMQWKLSLRNKCALAVWCKCLMTTIMPRQMIVW